MKTTPRTVAQRSTANPVSGVRSLPRLKPAIASLAKTAHFAAGLLAITQLAVAPLASAALPGAGDVTIGAGDATYTTNNVDAQSGEVLEATISASENSVVNFYEQNPAGNGFTVGANDTLNVESAAGPIQLLLDNQGDMPAQILGRIAGDGNVAVNVRSGSGMVFGADSSVTNVASLTATTHDFTAAEFIGFSNGSTPLELTAGGGSIEVQGLNLSDSGKLVMVADVVDIAGDIISSGEIHVAIGETVEMNLPGSGLLTVDITEALQNASGSPLSVASAARVEGSDIQFAVAVDDLLGAAVNLEGDVIASGVAVGSDGSITITGKGVETRLLGELNAADGAGDIALVGDHFELGDVTIVDGELSMQAASLDVQLGAAAAGDMARAGILNVNRLSYDDAAITVNGAAGFEHSVAGFGNYQVLIEQSGNGSEQVVLAGFGNAIDSASWAPGSVRLTNIDNLRATGQVENTILLGSGTTINSITGGGQNDTFIIEGQAQTLSGDGGRDVFNMQGGRVDLIAGGASTDEILNAFLRDENGQPTNIWDGQTSSDFIGQWTSIFRVTPAERPTVIENLVAGTPTFNGLGNVGSGALQLTGDAAVNRPCGALYDADFDRSDLSEEAKLHGLAVDAQGLPLADLEEPCHDPSEDSSDYLALMNTTIYFANDSSRILAPAAAKLNAVSAFVTAEDSNIRSVTVSGHTDSNASDAYNLGLSQRRAMATVDYMRSQGVADGLMSARYYGERLPAVSNDSDENLAKNRRAVIELKR